MPIRFFCEHCKQMLKIGSSKVGSVVNCPRCQKPIVIPLQSAPQAEEAYRLLKSQQALAPSLPHPAATSHPPSHSPSHPPHSPLVPTWEALEEEIDDADMPLWMEESWMPPPTSFHSTSSPVLTEEVALRTLQKRHKLTVTLLAVSVIALFFVGIIVGMVIRGLSVPSNRFAQQHADAASLENEVTGTLYYLNENGEKRPDVDAVILCLPKDRQPSTLLSCQGLRPEDITNNDTVQMIHEMGGMYERTDANGSFAFSYREGVRYLVILVSAHQERTGGEIKPSHIQELRRYFRDPELFGESCLHIDEYEWGKPLLRYTFDVTD